MSKRLPFACLQKTVTIVWETSFLEFKLTAKVLWSFFTQKSIQIEILLNE